MSPRLKLVMSLLFNALFFSALACDVADDSRIVIPFEVVNGLIIVEAEINNTIGNYIFDTGAEELVLNRQSTAGEILFSSINGDIATEAVDIDLLKIGSLTHNNLKAFATDLGSMESYLNMSLQGVIGCNLFIPRKIKIDFTTSEITLTNDDIITENKGYESFTMVDGVPICPLEIGGNKYFFGFDTGATMHVLDKNVVDDLDSHISDTGLDTYVTTGTGEKTINKIVAIDQLSLGTESFESSHFLVQNLEAFNQSMDQPISGVLSLTALVRNDIVIDLQKQRIYF